VDVGKQRRRCRAARALPVAPLHEEGEIRRGLAPAPSTLKK
jgi:hypothetical protein